MSDEDPFLKNLEIKSQQNLVDKKIPHGEAREGEITMHDVEQQSAFIRNNAGRTSGYIHDNRHVKSPNYNDVIVDAPTMVHMGGGYSSDDAEMQKIAEITENLDLDWADLISPGLASKDPNEIAATKKMLTKLQLNERQVNDVYADYSQNQELADPNTFDLPPDTSGWNVVKETTYNNVGKEINTYQVVDRLSGLSAGKKYKVQKVAECVCRVLRATNNLNDARLEAINESYSQYISLVKQRNRIKRNNGDTRGIEQGLREVKLRLGI